VGERNWTKIMDDLASKPGLGGRDMRDYAPSAAVDVATKLFERMRREMPTLIAAERLIVTAQSIIHFCADRARILDDADAARRHVGNRLFVDNLIDIIYGALFAPVSAAAAEVAAETASAGRDLRD
jgi:hypothetical protein